MFHHQHRGAAIGNAAHHGQQLVHHAGRQTERRLVEHQQARCAHHGARHGHHLLLTATHGAGQLLGALAQFREVAQDLLQAKRTVGARDQPPAQLQVFHDRHLGEKLPPLGHQGHATAHNLVGLFRQVIAIEQHHATARDQAHQRLEQRRFARTIGPKNHGEAGLDVQAQVAQHQKGAVAGTQAPYLQVRMSVVPQNERGFAVPHHGATSMFASAGSAISSPR